MHIRKILFLSKLALTIVLGYMVIRTLMIRQQPGDASVPSLASGTENMSEPDLTNSTDASIRDYSAIVGRDIFGGSGSRPKTSQSLYDENTGSSVRSVEEELGLVLVGTISGSPAVARAVIKDTTTDKVGLYRTGEAIAGGFVEGIESDLVILAHKGQKRILRLSTTSGRSANSSQLPPSQSANKAREVVKTASPTTQVPNESGEGMGRVEALLSKAVVTPYAVNDQIKGLKITGLENVPVAEDLGLKNGDVIRAVNGQRLTSKQHAYQVFKKARAKPSMSIELLRSGRTRRLSFALW